MPSSLTHTPTDIAANFVVEDGSIVDGANSYASVAEGDAHYTLHLYGQLWAAASTSQKQQALVMATRLINTSVVWKGAPITHLQRLQWPRQGVVLNYQLDLTVNPVLGYENTTYPSFMLVEPNIVPLNVKLATCELSRYLLIEDREVGRDNSTTKSEQVGPIKVEYFSNTYPDYLPTPVVRFLRDYVTNAPSDSGSANALVSQSRRG